ncbi:MAG: NADPH-dependent 7-cyano-7-deazaguanine reductase QueF [Cellvibrionales bacterium]|nr:NADPH-dependent 7-cyano-7-deazaguanine reductase QueF [Cellvibrionales bacterium]
MGNTKDTSVSKAAHSLSNNYASSSSLGEHSQYDNEYDPALLHPILRSEYRSTVANFVAPIYGHDLWQCFELSWLNNHGVPQVACADIIVPMASLAIVESKSLKLYLNSFHDRQFDDQEDVKKLIKVDLTALLSAEVKVVFRSASEVVSASSQVVEPLLLDNLEVTCSQYQRDPKLLLLKADNRQVSGEQFCSHLLRSHCPVTNQPDWGTLTIRYSGPAINPEALLRYIVSFRQHNGFHEQCVEQIFSDILSVCDPSQLCVYARYMRRGGLDINPFRSTSKPNPPRLRQVRQ